MSKLDTGNIIWTHLLCKLKFEMCYFMLWVSESAECWYFRSVDKIKTHPRLVTVTFESAFIGHKMHSTSCINPHPKLKRVGGIKYRPVKGNDKETLCTKGEGIPTQGRPYILLLYPIMRTEAHK